VGRAKKPPTEPPKNAQRIERLEGALSQAQDKLREMVGQSDDSISGARSRALQSQRVWDLQALLSQEKGEIEDAARAARASTRAGELAARLERDSLADRVLELERTVAEQRKAGARVQALAERTRT
jgi:hypothetical protein